MFGLIEEAVLLLIAQHLDGGLAQHCEIQCGTLRSGIGKDKLMREGGFTAAGCTRDDIEGIFGQAAAEDLIKSGNTRGELPNFHSFLLLFIFRRRTHHQIDPPLLFVPRRPGFAHQPERHRFANKCGQQREKMPGNRESCIAPLMVRVNHEFFESVQRTVWVDYDLLQRRDFRSCQGHRASHKRCNASGANESRERNSKLVANAHRRRHLRFRRGLAFRLQIQQLPG